LVAARSSSAALKWPRRSVRKRSSSSTARASSNMSITAWLSLPRHSGDASARAGPMPSARSRSVVAHMHTVVPPRRRMSPSVRCVAWTMQLPLPSAPCSSSSSAGVRPWAARHASFSARCSDRCACSGALRSRAHSATVASWSAGTARTEWIAAPIRACGAARSAEARSAHACASPSEKRCWAPSGGVPNPLAR
jgi:hypothetical protein